MTARPTDPDCPPDEEPPDVPMYCRYCEAVTAHRPVEVSMAPDDFLWQCERAGAHRGPPHSTRP